MMLRGLLEEIVRRRLWPVALAALLVAVAAPLLFLKSAPAGAPSPEQAAASAPAAPAVGELPARAQRLLQTADSGPSPRKRPKKAQDPFQAPSGVHAPSGAATSAAASKPATTASSAGSAKAKPVPVVITDANGKKVHTTTDSSSSSDGSSATTSTATVARIDVRFSKHGTHNVLRAIALHRPFTAGGKLLAIYVRYSSAHKAAVFAVSPGTVVKGVQCRDVAGICRYVDLPAGRSARLTLVTPQGQLITRRIDVVHATLVADSGDAAKSAPGGACLQRKLLGLGLGDPPVQRDACA